MRISLFRVLTHRVIGALIVVVSLFSFNALALPTIEEYGARASTSHVAISPSGHLIAYRKEADNKTVLVIYSRQAKKCYRRWM
ncbi:MAG: hypothetical protein U5M23_16170 [Marinagarivorans sp.]|nr:hypothetical protein [Marinagarivorans sp.]